MTPPIIDDEPMITGQSAPPIIDDEPMITGQSASLYPL